MDENIASLIFPKRSTFESLPHLNSSVIVQVLYISSVLIPKFIMTRTRKFQILQNKTKISNIRPSRNIHWKCEAVKSLEIRHEENCIWRHNSCNTHRQDTLKNYRSTTLTSVGAGAMQDRDRTFIPSRFTTEFAVEQLPVNNVFLGSWPKNETLARTFVAQQSSYHMVNLQTHRSFPPDKIRAVLISLTGPRRVAG